MKRPVLIWVIVLDERWLHQKEKYSPEECRHHGMAAVAAVVVNLLRSVYTRIYIHRMGDGAVVQSA